MRENILWPKKVTNAVCTRACVCAAHPSGLITLTSRHHVVEGC